MPDYEINILTKGHTADADKVKSSLAGITQEAKAGASSGGLFGSAIAGAAARLATFAAIGFYDVNELIWRTWFSGSGRQLNPFSDLSAVIQANEAYVAELHAAMAELQGRNS